MKFIYLLVAIVLGSIKYFKVLMKNFLKRIIKKVLCKVISFINLKIEQFLEEEINLGIKENINRRYVNLKNKVEVITV